MNYFYAIVQKSAGSVFGITFPDLPGCFSGADRIDDVVPMAIEAIDLWFEEQEEIEPSSFGTVVVEAREELAAGAFLIAVPRIRSGAQVIRFNITMDQALVESIDTAAKLRGLTRNAFIVEAARQLIEGGV